MFADAGSVQHLFYSEIEKGNIHSRIKTSKGNIVAFEMGDLYIEENPNIERVLRIICKLDQDNSVAKYREMGQQLYTLVYEFFTKRFYRKIVSYCSPQVYHVLTYDINSPFLEFYKNSGKVGCDKDKQYTSILRSCDTFGWPIFNPTDELKKFNLISNIETGLYFIEAFNSFPLKGNGLYFGGVVEKALK